MTPSEIFMEATQRGLRLKPAGDKLAVTPKGQCPPDFADLLRAHKIELLDWLEARAHNLTADCAPWLHVAKQILEGEFDGADRSTVTSLTIGLRSIHHPLCQQALQRIMKSKAK
jgi:hypothetical protein